MRGYVQKPVFAKYFLIYSLAAMAVMLSLVLLPTSVSASTGISLTPFESIKVDISPGETITHRINLQLGTQDQAMDIVVNIMGYGNSLDGTVQTIAAAQDTGPYSARSFVTIDKPLFHLEPGGSQDIMATISVPKNVGDGGKYAIIYIHELPPAGAGTGSLSAFNIPILLTIKGSTLTHTGNITEIKAGDMVSGRPIEIFTSFQNTGNHHFKVTGEVIVTNSQGEVLGTVQMPLSASSVIPDTLRQVSADFVPKGTLPQGVYSLKSRLILEDGTTLDSATGSFEVKNSYVPPTVPATTTPLTTSTLQSSASSTSPSTSSGALPVALLAGVAAGAAILITLMVVMGRKKK